MDTETCGKRQITTEQLHGLLEYLKDHRVLAKGLSRGRRGKFTTLQLWNQCAKKLNAYKDGAVRDGRGWSKYWCDWKYRIRRKALEIKSGNGTLSDNVITPLEENVLAIIGEESIDSVIIKSDPLADGETGDEDHDISGYSNGSVLNNGYSDSILSLRSSRKRQHSTLEHSVDHDGSSPCERKPRLSSFQNGDESDHDEAMEFIRLEKENLEHSKSVDKSLKTIASELTRLTDALCQIRDVLVKREE